MTLQRIESQSNSRCFTKECYTHSSKVLLVTSLALAIIGLIGFCELPGLGVMDSYWYLFEVGAIATFIWGCIWCSKGDGCNFVGSSSISDENRDLETRQILDALQENIRENKEELALLKTGPKRVSDGKPFHGNMLLEIQAPATEISFEIGRFQLLDIRKALKDPAEPAKRIACCSNLIKIFDEMYRLGVFEIQNNNPGPSPVGEMIAKDNKHVADLMNQIERKADEIVTKVIAKTFRDKNNPPAEFVGSNLSASSQMLKSKWEQKVSSS
jgi:hypothetical protein